MAGVPLAEAVGLLEPRKVSLKESANSTRDDLKPVVLTLAMLLLMTSICSWNCWMPLTPELRERSIVFLSVKDWEQARWRAPCSDHSPGCLLRVAASRPGHRWR